MQRVARKKIKDEGGESKVTQLHTAWMASAFSLLLKGDEEENGVAAVGVNRFDYDVVDKGCGRRCCLWRWWRSPRRQRTDGRTD